MNLAPIIADDLGKTVGRGVMKAAKDAYDAMIRNFAQPIEMQFPDTMPAGQGNKPYRWEDYNNFLNTPLDVPLVDPLNEGSDNLNRQYESPTASGFSIAVTDGPDSVYLIITPTSAFASGTIVLPAVANVSNYQEVLVISSQTITTLTVDANGAENVLGAPAFLQANTPFRLRFDPNQRIWNIVDY
jgi:hypothetical protein